MNYDHPNPHRKVIGIFIGFISFAIFIFFAYYYLFYLVGFFDQCSGCTAVDKNHCQCGCFDGLNKGIYGRGGYKFIYYNIEKETYFLVIWFVLFFYGFIRTIEYIINLIFKGSISKLWVFALITLIYSAWYCMWCVWGYINDSLYHLLYHQVFFTATEYLAIICIILNLNSSIKSSLEFHFWILLYISLVHIVQAQLDQGLYHIITFNARHVALLYRDILFLIGDFTVLISTLFTMHQRRKFGERFFIERYHFAILISTVVLTCFFLSFVTFGG